MPVYNLDGTADAHVPGGSALRVSWSLHGSTAAVRLEALINGEPTDRVERPRPDLLIIPPVTAAVTLRVVPIDDTPFSTPSEIEVQLIIGDQRSPDPQIVQLAAMKLSGLPSRNLLLIEEVGTLTRISALDSPPEPQMSHLGDQARAAARTVLGMANLPGNRATVVSVVVDTSASMQPLLQDGTVAAALDVLAGIAQVIAPQGQLRATAVGDKSTWLTPAAPGEFAAASVKELERSDLSSGFCSAAIPRAASSDQRSSMTYIVTDGVPADLDQNLSNPQVHLLALTSAEAWKILGADAGAPATVLEPGTALENSTARLLKHPEELLELVHSALTAVSELNK